MLARRCLSSTADSTVARTHIVCVPLTRNFDNRSKGSRRQEKWLTWFCFSCHCGRPCARGGARPRSTCARRRSRSGLPWSIRHRNRVARRSAGRSALATKNVALRSALERKWLLLLSDHTGEKFELLGVCRLIDLVSRRTIDHLSVSFTESKVLTWSLFSM